MGPQLGLWRETHWRWVCVLGEGVTSNTPIAWTGAVGVWRLPFLSAAALPFLNSHSGDKSPNMVSWGQGHERDSLLRWLWERSFKLALPLLEERPLLSHHLPWGPWGSATFPSLHCPLVSLKVGWKGETEAGRGPGQVTGHVDSNALSLWPGHSPCCRSPSLSSFWRSVSGWWLPPPRSLPCLLGGGGVSSLWFPLPTTVYLLRPTFHHCSSCLLSSPLTILAS